MLLTHDLRDVLEDSRADDLATVLNRALHELLALEHRSDLCIVLRSLAVELVLRMDQGWLRHLLSNHRLLSRVLLHHSLVVLLHLSLLVVRSRLLALVARPVLVTVGVLGTIGTLVADVELVQNEAKRGDQGHQIRTLGAHVPRDVTLVCFLVELLLDCQLSRLLRLTVIRVEEPAHELELGAAILSIAGTFTVFEGDKCTGCFWDELDIVHLAKLPEEFSDLFIGGLLLNTFDDQGKLLHGLLELVSLLLQIFLPLLLGLELCDIERRIVLGPCVFVSRNCLVGILPLFEADEPEALALL